MEHETGRRASVAVLETDEVLTEAMGADADVIVAGRRTKGQRQRSRKRQGVEHVPGRQKKDDSPS